MKKGIFSVMHYFLPKQGVLSLHSSANEVRRKQPLIKSYLIIFVLRVRTVMSLSSSVCPALARPHCRLIRVASSLAMTSTVGPIRASSTSRAVATRRYALLVFAPLTYLVKCINLSSVTEPEIFGAIKFGTVLENVEFDPYSREVDYNSAAITENTRSSYPIEYIPNAKVRPPSFGVALANNCRSLALVHTPRTSSCSLATPSAYCRPCRSSPPSRRWCAVS